MKKGRQDRIAETLTKKIITVLSKIIELIVENTAMFFKIIPMKKIIY